jgi:hypothetical protein
MIFSDILERREVATVLLMTYNDAKVIVIAINL